MNITVKLDDQLVRAARHRAVDSGVSLSGWLASLIEREVSAKTTEKQRSARPMRLLDALGDDSPAGLDFDPPALKDSPVAMVFEES